MRSTKLKLLELQRELKLALAQDQGCGGNLTEKEIVDNTYAVLCRILAQYGKMETVVILCPACEGTGSLTHEECTDYHRRDYTTYYNDCHTCGNTGRVQRTTITLADEPYVSDRR